MLFHWISSFIQNNFALLNLQHQRMCQKSELAHEPQEFIFLSNFLSF